MKQRAKSIRIFLLGFLAATTLFGALMFSFADPILKNIKVLMGGISIYIDGKEMKPLDAKGRTVEPLIYDGTTYLPVRALTNMLTNKPVEWDGKLKRVLIGKKIAGSEVPLDQVPLLQGKGMYTGKDALVPRFDKMIRAFNSTEGYGDKSPIFVLDSNYKRLKGSFAIPVKEVGLKYFDEKGNELNVVGKLVIYQVDGRGDKTPIKEFIAKPGDDPIQVDVDVTGCNMVQVYNQTYTYKDEDRDYEENWGRVYYPYSERVGFIAHKSFYNATLIAAD